MLRTQLWVLMLGEAFLKEGMSSLKEHAGGLAMANPLRFGSTIKHPTSVSSPMLESMEEVTVECLINADTRSWNEEMIDGIFIPQEAELIKKIPLSWFEVDDSLFWPLSPNGQYSCKLGHRFLREEVDFNRLEEPPD